MKYTLEFDRAHRCMHGIEMLNFYAAHGWSHSAVRDALSTSSSPCADLRGSQNSHSCTYKLHSIHFVHIFFSLSTLYWPMYLLNLAFPLMSRGGRHVPSCRLVTDPNNPTYPVRTGLHTGLTPPVVPAKNKISTTQRFTVKHIWSFSKRIKHFGVG